MKGAAHRLQIWNRCAGVFVCTAVGEKAGFGPQICAVSRIYLRRGYSHLMHTVPFFRHYPYLHNLRIYAKEY